MARFELLGIPVDEVTMASSVDVAKAAVVNQQQVSILAVNPEKVIAARENETLRSILQRSELLIPDGIGAVIGAKLKGAKTISRVPGAELMPELCKMAEHEGCSVYLFGASEEVNRQAAESLQKMFPGLNLAGRHHGYVAPEQYPALIADINASKAHLLFVALGSPKQEIFIGDHRDALDVNVLQGVGGTFDVIAGNVARAPKVWRKLNLEWFYRLLAQPSRMLRQTALPKFVILMLADVLGRKSGR